jgi:HEAT repeat protein
MLPTNSLIPLVALLLAQPAVWGQDESKQKIRGLKDYAREGSPAIPKIVPYLQDADVEVRREAVRGLVQIGTQRSLEPLTAACRDNDAEVQIRATDGLVNFYLPGYVERGVSATLKRAGNSVIGRWTQSANEDIVEPDTPLRPEIAEVLSTLVKSGSSIDSRANAARALGILRARSGLPALTEALKSKDSRLMFESLIAIQKIGDRSAGDRAAFLIRDLDEKVQLAAIETAGILGSKEAVPQLMRVLENPRSKQVRRAALVSLAQISDPASRQVFLPLVEDKDEGARAAAAEGLGRLANPEDRAVLEKAWESDRKTASRLATAFALVRLGNLEPGDFQPLGFLINSLNQKAWRGVAVPYLSELALQKRQRQAILSALSHVVTSEEKTGLCQVLAGCGSADAIAPLEQLSRDSDPAVAREALRSLRILRGSVR